VLEQRAAERPQALEGLERPGEQQRRVEDARGTPPDGAQDEGGAAVDGDLAEQPTGAVDARAHVAVAVDVLGRAGHRPSPVSRSRETMSSTPRYANRRSPTAASAERT